MVEKGIGDIPLMYISDRTNLKKREVITTKGYCRTKYFSQKKTAILALRIFRENKDWANIEFEIEYENELNKGIVSASINRKAFLEYWGIDESKITNKTYSDSFWLKPKIASKIRAYADEFTTRRFNRIAPMNTQLEAFVENYWKKNRIGKQ